ncbi:hypothetical protein [Nocardioides phosphati]|uniref:hypothetical protein n=1 Tax=Nocardioides phosphati TaxID=1867775 RepID=UPI0016628CCF|nr:hypothetical protein [Nocardioides phosphati]
MNGQQNSIPVVDVDSAFPAMVERPTGRRSTVAPGDLGPQVETALRDVLGWRPRPDDPAAFTNALNAAFRLRRVQGHTEADFVPRGYAVQADLGAVTGGQASLYRRATLVRSEALRILDGLVPLRPDADDDDMASYRLLVRNAVERLVDEIGAAGGPRVQMVNMYFAGLTGKENPIPGVTADTVAGQLGALRDRFGLTDGNVNTVEEEGIRTAYWTLVDLLLDLQGSWRRQVKKFSGGTGQGFLGTELILLSRLMEAAADQVEELEDVLDSVLITQSERRTLVLDDRTGLTVDGLLTWLHDFLSQEGRRIAQDAGRDGIVSGLAPMAVALVKAYRKFLADPVAARGLKEINRIELPVVYLPATCCDLPAGMFAARTKIAVASLSRLLTDLAKSAQRIGRWAQPVLVNATFLPVAGRDDVTEVRVRGFNLRLTHIPAFVRKAWEDDDCQVASAGTKGLLLPLEGSSTADDESVSALFRTSKLLAVFNRYDVPARWDGEQAVVMAADALPMALVDGERGVVEVAPEVVTFPLLDAAGVPDEDAGGTWPWLKQTRAFQTTPAGPLVDVDDVRDARAAADGGGDRLKELVDESFQRDPLVARMHLNSLLAPHKFVVHQKPSTKNDPKNDD